VFVIPVDLQNGSAQVKALDGPGSSVVEPQWPVWDIKASWPGSPKHADF